MSQLDLKQNLDMTKADFTPIFQLGSVWELSLKGTWTGTVSVLRRFKPTDDWGVVREYTENIEDSAFFKGPAIAYFMVVVGAIGTGTCTVRCYR